MNGRRVFIMTEPEYRDLLRMVDDVLLLQPDNTTTSVVAQLKAAKFEPVPSKVINNYRHDQQREIDRRNKAR